MVSPILPLKKSVGDLPMLILPALAFLPVVVVTPTITQSVLTAAVTTASIYTIVVQPTNPVNAIALVSKST